MFPQCFIIKGNRPHKGTYQMITEGCAAQFFPAVTLSQTTNFRLPKLKVFAEDNFKFDENSRKFSKRVENTVRKGEFAHQEQFLFFPQCFQKTCNADT